MWLVSFEGSKYCRIRPARNNALTTTIREAFSVFAMEGEYRPETTPLIPSTSPTRINPSPSPNPMRDPPITAFRALNSMTAAASARSAGENGSANKYNAVPEASVRASATPAETLPGVFLESRAWTAFCSANPTPRATTKITVLRSKPMNATIAGPGHKPVRLQPAPNSAEPKTSGAFKSVRVGIAYLEANAGCLKRGLTK
mmetsp:Transcript_8199/g.14845  ORF Transcript_8199/g.14845 Transcript_8199/m.14845 type:complete len:201 (+) Transcript_8199:1211-1813(+)